MPNLRRISHTYFLSLSVNSTASNNAAHAENFIYDHRHKMLINFFNMIYLIVQARVCVCMYLTLPHHIMNLLPLTLSLYKRTKKGKEIYSCMKCELCIRKFCLGVSRKEKNMEK